MDKYNSALKICGARKIFKGDPTYLAAKALIDLRHWLTHYKRAFITSIHGWLVSRQGTERRLH